MGSGCDPGRRRVGTPPSGSPRGRAAVRRLYESLSDESRYRRFFSPASPAAAAALGTRVDIDDRHFALVVEIGDEIVGVADYFRKPDDVAEVAFTVRDDQQGRGFGTQLLDHLAEVATARGIRCFVAQVLARNQPMRRVFSDAGFEVTWSRPEIGVVEVILDLAQTGHWADTHSEREHRAEAQSIARLLSPHSIAVIGASRRDDSIGHAVLRNLLTGAFAGPVYPVNPNATSIEGVDAQPSVLAIPGPVDLAIVAVPVVAVENVFERVREEGPPRPDPDLERIRRGR